MVWTRFRDFFSLALVWLLLTRGAVASWFIGIPAIALALFVKNRLPKLSAFRLSMTAFFPFLFYFMKQSLLGGVDIALRVFQRDMRLSPSFMTYHFRVKNQIARLFFANTISLLPGTLSADIQGDAATIHLLDLKLNNREQLNILEEKVASLFGEEI